MVQTNNETIEHKPQTINHPWNYVGSCLELPIVYYQTRPLAIHDQKLTWYFLIIIIKWSGIYILESLSSNHDSDINI